MMKSSEFLTDAQLAARWQIHRSTLIRWRRQEIGPPFMRINTKVLYPISGVEQYEKTNTNTPEQS
jgi:hypothetical protein